ncbi:MAG TPA: SDR family oxidoreductase [Streptosporangiaceae bacterium]|nr:SDR family oxidoreductase [Streptosporangiaceae bacterium]
MVAAALMEAGGAIDVLVNSAGATVRGTIEETTSELFAGALDLNLASVVRLCRLTAPAMRRQGRGSIIDIASITSTEGMSGAVAYTASKGGLTAMTRALAIELAPSEVRVNAVSPSVVDSPMTHNYVRTRPDAATHYQELLLRQPMGRMACPRDVALGRYTDRRRFSCGGEWRNSR